MGRARWKGRTEDRGVGCYPIRALNDFSFEAEEAAIAEAVSGINPLDQGMSRELAIPSAGVKDRADGLAEKTAFSRLTPFRRADPEGQLRVDLTRSLSRRRTAAICAIQLFRLVAMCLSLFKSRRTRHTFLNPFSISRALAPDKGGALRRLWLASNEPPSHPAARVGYAQGSEFAPAWPSTIVTLSPPRKPSIAALICWLPSVNPAAAYCAGVLGFADAARIALGFDRPAIGECGRPSRDHCSRERGIERGDVSWI